mmetsp:Transcript_8031/g.22917  ORF Transcript_8031/g.22917 Transcript_8031/m.22917 type:complete len:619 (-) Transcript_8031:140-1996(-)
MAVAKRVSLLMHHNLSKEEAKFSRPKLARTLSSVECISEVVSRKVKNRIVFAIDTLLQALQGYAIRKHRKSRREAFEIWHQWCRDAAISETGRNYAMAYESLRVTPNRRSRRDRQNIKSWLLKANVFPGLDDIAMEDFCMHVEIHQISSGEPLFLQRSRGTRYFVHFSGKLELWALDNQEEEQARLLEECKNPEFWKHHEVEDGFLGTKIVSLPTGMGLGEFSLMPPYPPRSCSAAGGPGGAVVMSLDKPNYQRILLSYHGKNLFYRNAASFFKSLRPFAKWPGSSLTQFVYFGKQLKFDMGATIITRGQPATKLIFIADGKVHLKKKNIQVAILSTKSLVGQECLPAGYDARTFGVPMKPRKEKAEFDVVAETPTTVYVMEVAKVLELMTSTMTGRETLQMLVADYDLERAWRHKQFQRARKFRVKRAHHPAPVNPSADAASVVPLPQLTSEAVSKAAAGPPQAPAPSWGGPHALDLDGRASPQVSSEADDKSRSKSMDDARKLLDSGEGRMDRMLAKAARQAKVVRAELHPLLHIMLEESRHAVRAKQHFMPYQAPVRKAANIPQIGLLGRGLGGADAEAGGGGTQTVISLALPSLAPNRESIASRQGRRSRRWTS